MTERRHPHPLDRQRVEDRIVKIQHRLVVDKVCNDSGKTSGSREMEEELLGEVAELERSLGQREWSLQLAEPVQGR